MKFIKAIIILTVIVGTMGFAFNLIFGNGAVSYITQIDNNGVIMQKYDFWGYIQNVKKAFTDTAVLELKPLPTDSASGEWWQILNILRAFANGVFMVCNIILYPFRLAAYVMRAILALVGIPVLETEGNPMNWLITVIKTLIQLEIPYLQFD